MAFPRIGVIFDCDGTLVDSMAAWRALEEDLAARAGRVFTREDADALTVRTIPECGEYVHEKFELGESPADVERMINDFMFGYYSAQVGMRPGAAGFVRALADLGVVMGVASATPQHLLDACFEHLGLTSCFEDIVSVDRVGASKRQPLVYDYVRAALGTDLSFTWGFEDALYAVRTLKAAGYSAVGVYDDDLAGTFEDLRAHADLAVRSFHELSADDFMALATRRA